MLRSDARHLGSHTSGAPINLYGPFPDPRKILPILYYCKNFGAILRVLLRVGACKMGYVFQTIIMIHHIQKSVF